MTNAIRFIVETVSSAPDSNGNRYHFATITSTLTGRQLKIADVGGETNATALLRNISDATCFVSNHTLPSHQWSREHKRMGTLYEHQVTTAMLRALESL